MTSSFDKDVFIRIAEAAIGLVALTIGGLIYIRYRSESLLMFDWFHNLGLSDSIEDFRSNSEMPNVYDWVKYNLPAGLWLFAYMFVIDAVWGKDNNRVSMYFLYVLPLLAAAESTGKGIRGFRYADLTNNKGRDIAFFDEAGNHLASEIQTNDWTTSGESLVWVGIPRMQRGTKFYLCYNTTDSGVFVTNQNPWTDYVAVWHMDEEGGENKPIFDSTTNKLHGVNYSTTGAKVSEGAIGRARKIANSNAHDKGIIVEATNGLKKAAADSLGTDFHASFWMSPQGNNTTNRKWSNLLGRRKGDKGESWGVSIDDDAKGLRIYADGTQTTKNDQQRFVSTYRDTGHGLTTTAVPPTISNQFPFLDAQGGWNKIDILWKYTTAENNACYEVYSNGVLAAAGVLIGPVSDVPANIGIGCSTQDAYGSSPAENKGRRFYGDMDEVRLRPGIVSADWIKATSIRWSFRASWRLRRRRCPGRTVPETRRA